MRSRPCSSFPSLTRAAARFSTVSSRTIPVAPSSTISGSMPRFAAMTGFPSAMHSRTARHEPSDPGTRKTFTSMQFATSTKSPARYPAKITCPAMPSRFASSWPTSRACVPRPMTSAFNFGSSRRASRMAAKNISNLRCLCIRATMPAMKFSSVSPSLRMTAGFRGRGLKRSVSIAPSMRCTFSRGRPHLCAAFSAMALEKTSSASQRLRTSCSVRRPTDVASPA